jgi:hypothetical protein
MPGQSVVGQQSIGRRPSCCVFLASTLGHGLSGLSAA